MSIIRGADFFKIFTIGVEVINYSRRKKYNLRGESATLEIDNTIPCASALIDFCRKISVIVFVWIQGHVIKETVTEIVIFSNS